MWNEWFYTLQESENALSSFHAPTEQAVGGSRSRQLLPVKCGGNVMLAGTSCSLGPERPPEGSRGLVISSTPRPWDLLARKYGWKSVSRGGQACVHKYTCEAVYMHVLCACVLCTWGVCVHAMCSASHHRSLFTWHLWSGLRVDSLERIWRSLFYLSTIHRHLSSFSFRLL